nr:MAG TPA: hypothetical protein [Caudoviricetes sp.]
MGHRLENDYDYTMFSNPPKKFHSFFIKKIN